MNNYISIKNNNPFLKNRPYLAKGVKLNLVSIFGSCKALVTEISGDKGQAESGDLLFDLKRIDGIWHQSTWSINKNALRKVKLV